MSEIRKASLEILLVLHGMSDINKTRFLKLFKDDYIINMRDIVVSKLHNPLYHYVVKEYEKRFCQGG